MFLFFVGRADSSKQSLSIGISLSFVSMNKVSTGARSWSIETERNDTNTIAIVNFDSLLPVLERCKIGTDDFRLCYFRCVYSGVQMFPVTSFLGSFSRHSARTPPNMPNYLFLKEYVQGLDGAIDSQYPLTRYVLYTS